MKKSKKEKNKDILIQITNEYNEYSSKAQYDDLSDVLISNKLHNKNREIETCEFNKCGKKKATLQAAFQKGGILPRPCV